MLHMSVASRAFLWAFKRNPAIEERRVSNVPSSMKKDHSANTAITRTLPALFYKIYGKSDRDLWTSGKAPSVPKGEMPSSPTFRCFTLTRHLDSILGQSERQGMHQRRRQAMGGVFNHGALVTLAHCSSTT